MSELYDKIVSERGTLQNLAARIPGFGGYMDRGARRTADRMIRDFIAAQMSKQIDRMGRIEKSILDKHGLSLMSNTRDAKTKMQTYQDRVKTAAPGYAGLFSAINIGEEELARIYSFDEAQIRYVDQFTPALDTLEQAVNSGEGIEEAISAVYQVAVEANDAFALREDVLTQIDKSL